MDLFLDIPIHSLLDWKTWTQRKHDVKLLLQESSFTTMVPLTWVCTFAYCISYVHLQYSIFPHKSPNFVAWNPATYIFFFSKSVSHVQPSLCFSPNFSDICLRAKTASVAPFPGINPNCSSLTAVFPLTFFLYIFFFFFYYFVVFDMSPQFWLSHFFCTYFFTDTFTLPLHVPGIFSWLYIFFIRSHTTSIASSLRLFFSGFSMLRLVFYRLRLSHASAGILSGPVAFLFLILFNTTLTFSRVFPSDWLSHLRTLSLGFPLYTDFSKLCFHLPFSITFIQQPRV